MDTAYRALALNVLLQALIDAVHPTPVKFTKDREELRQDAQAFLFGAEEETVLIRSHWIEQSGLNTKWFTDYSHHVVDHQIRVQYLTMVERPRPHEDEDVDDTL